MILRSAPKRALVIFVPLLLCSLGASTSPAWALPTPESQTLALSRTLKPIADDRWKEIAGERITEQYTVVEKDTLYDISKRLFGDPSYWPKIWALNNRGITNPHFIRPGKQIAFLPGTGSSLPGVEIADASSSPEDTGGRAGGGSGGGQKTSSDARGPYIPDRKGRSSEWRKLPPQAWETVQIALPPEVDPDGFDRRSRIPTRQVKGFELNAIASTEPIESMGTITASRDLSLGLGLGDTVFIRGEKELQPGQVYAVTNSPIIVRRPGKDGAQEAVGMIYRILGKVEITSKSDELFVGRINGSQGVQTRGCTLIPMPARVEILPPIPGPSPIEAKVYVDRSSSTETFAQFHQVYLDRGKEDGIAPGMIFRAYQYRDPYNEEKITDSKFIRNADLEVVQVSENFSTAVVSNTLVPLREGAVVTLLTDVSDVGKHGDVAPTAPVMGGTPPAPDELGPTPTPEPSPEASPGASDLDLNAPAEPAPAPETAPVAPTPPPPAETPAPANPPANDELDQLDDGKELQEGEKKELKQLEDWKGNPTTEGTAPPSTGAPTAPAPAPAPATPGTPPPPATAPIDDLDSDLNLQTPPPASAPSTAAPAPAPAPTEQVPALPPSLDEGSAIDPDLVPDSSAGAPAAKKAAPKAGGKKKGNPEDELDF